MDNKLIGKGRTAEVYSYSDNKIMKLYNEKVSKKSIEKEVSIYEVLNGLELVPNYYALEEIDGKYALIQERATGKSMLSMIESNILKVNTFGKMMAKIHYDMHTYYRDLPNSFQNDFFNLQGSFLSTVDFEEVKAYVVDLCQQFPQISICHGDFHPDNVIIGDNIKVIDWANAYTGSPLSDVAKTLLILSSPSVPDDISGLTRVLLKSIKNRLKKSYLKEYLRLSQYTKTDIDSWILPMAVIRLSDHIEMEKDWLEGIIQEQLVRVSN